MQARYGADSIVQPTQSAGVTETRVVAVLAMLIFGATAGGMGASSARFVVLGAFFLVVGWLILRSPAHLVLVSVITLSTVPGIIFGPILTPVGGGRFGPNQRSEYFLFAILANFFMLRQPQTRFRAPLDGPVAAFVIIQCISVVSALFRGDWSFSLGPVIRLIEGYSFYFLASRLTSRDQIPSLIRAMTAIGALVALAIIVTSITGNQELYVNFFSGSPDPDDVARSHWLYQFFRGYEQPRIGYIEADPLLLMTLAVSVVMLFQVSWRSPWYCCLVSLIALRMLTAGQRFQIAFLIATLLLSAALLSRRSTERGKGLQFSSWIVLGLLALALATLLSSGEWATRWEVLGIRSRDTLAHLTSVKQTLGIRLAWSELLDDPLGWGAGFSPFRHSIPVDINLGVLLTVYRYGLGGLVVLLWLLGASVVQALRLLRSDLIPEERALVCAVVIFIAIYVANGFVRNMVFNETGTTVVVFSICLGWVQVIWRNMQPDGMGVKA